MGRWQGAAPPSLSGEVCNLKLELKGEEADSRGIKGYGTVQCTALGPLVSAQAKGNLRAALDIATRGVATSVLMTGTTQKDGVMQFHIDKVIGPESPDGCVMSSFKVTPFGSQLLSEWQNGDARCKGGEATLNRVR